jgi:hypothetical protein
MPKYPAEFVSGDPIYAKFGFSWSVLGLNQLFCCVLAGCLRHAAMFFPYPKSKFCLGG